jgi:hypothetical protein
MRVLVAEYEDSIYMYRVVPEHKNHEATITKDGQTCLETCLGTPNMKSRPS